MGNTGHSSSGDHRSDQPNRPPATLSPPNRPSPLPDKPISQSPSLVIPRSPPRTVVSVRGQTLIVPNTSLARAIVTGNERSQEVTAEDWNQLTETHEREVSRGKSAPRMHSAPTKPAISNLTVLLQQQQQEAQNLLERHVEGAIASAGSSPNSKSSDHTVTEADTASGPPPPPCAALGRSAPNILSRDNAEPLLRQLSEGRQEMISRLVAKASTSAESDAKNRRSKSPHNAVFEHSEDHPRR